MYDMYCIGRRQYQRYLNILFGDVSVAQFLLKYYRRVSHHKIQLKLKFEDHSQKDVQRFCITNGPLLQYKIDCNHSAHYWAILSHAGTRSPMLIKITYVSMVFINDLKVACTSAQSRQSLCCSCERWHLRQLTPNINVQSLETNCEVYGL